MNDFEQQLIDRVLESVHGLEVQLTKELGEVKGDIKTLGEKGSNEHQALKETVERNISTDTQRLNDHSEEIDALKENQAVLMEWKDSVGRSITNRVILIGGGMAVLAVLVAYVLDKV